QARFERGQLVVPTREGEMTVPLAEDGTFAISASGTVQRAKPFVEKRAWHMGVILAAIELKLDLDHAEIDLPHGRITLHGPNGIERVIPVDRDGYFYVDWCIPPNHPALTQEPIHELLAQNKLRLDGKTEGLTNRWWGKLAVVGSSAVVGNNLTDVGATPL